MHHSFLFLENDKSRKYKIFTAAFAFLLFILSVQSGGMGPEFPFFDKLMHMGAYFILCLSACKAFEKKENFFEIAFLFAFSYGVLMEFTQIFAMGRHFEILDMFANGLGAGLVYLAVYHDLNVFNRERKYLSFLR